MIEPDNQAEASAANVGQVQGGGLEGIDLLMTFNKDQLEDYARKHFGRELDKRKKLETLRAEVISLYNGDTQRREAREAEAKALAERRAKAKPKLVRHKVNGTIWEWNPNFEGNHMLEVIEWEDEEG